MSFRRLLYALGCAALAALTLALLAAAALLNTTRHQVELLPSIVDRNLKAARTDLTRTINRQGDSARETIRSQLDQIRTDTNQHVTEAIERLDAQLTKVTSIAGPVKSAVEKVDSALPFYTDCDSGMCLANVIYGIGQNTERTLQSVDRTMAVIAAKSPPVAESVERSAAALEQRSRQSILRNLFFGLKTPKK